jgi:hypothetical protein
MIEEHHLAAPAGASALGPNTEASNYQYERRGLSTWRPNLAEFIRSAGVEWNWMLFVTCIERIELSAGDEFALERLNVHGSSALSSSTTAQAIISPLVQRHPHAQQLGLHSTSTSTSAYFTSTSTPTSIR